MDTSSKAPTSAIRADGDNDRQYVIWPQDKDLIVRTGRQIIQACQLSVSFEVWWEEMKSMMDELSSWAKVKSRHVSQCFVALHGARVQLFVCPRGETFDFELAGDMADLNSEVVKKYNVGMVEMRQVPSSEIDRFINHDTAWKIHDEKPGTS